MAPTYNAVLPRSVGGCATGGACEGGVAQLKGVNPVGGWENVLFFFGIIFRFFPCDSPKAKRIANGLQ